MVAWTSEMDAKLLVAIIKTAKPTLKIDHEAVSKYMNNEVSAYAIQHRMRKIYAKVKEGTSEPNTPAKPKTDADEGTPSTTPTPSPRKRAPAANGAKARGRAKRKLAEDDEEEQPNSTKKTKQVKKEVPAAEDQI